jgi:hypothetical protein
MKHIGFIALAVATLSSTPAQAFLGATFANANQPARPSEESVLVLESSEGKFDRSDLETIKIQKLARPGNPDMAAGFNLVLNESAPIRFSVETSDLDECGSVTFKGQVQEQKTGEIYTLSVVDHSTRICKDYQEFVWNVKLKVKDQIKDQELGRLKLNGNPIPLKQIFVPKL